MTDRELLEAAAKAAGLTLWHENVFTSGLTLKVSDNGVLRWNPLTDDGDALRLAVKLALDFYEGNDDGKAAYVGYYEPNGGTRPQRFITERHDEHEDPCAATRRAIVRAAARTQGDAK